MNKIEQYLSEFDDTELAFFARFKKSTYLKPTQEKIDDILFKRGLTKHKVEALIKNIDNTIQEDNALRCPRCHSKKIRSDKVELKNSGNGGGSIFALAPIVDSSIKGKVSYDYEVICNVCGFWLNDPNEEKPKNTTSKLLNWLRNFFNGVIDT